MKYSWLVAAFAAFTTMMLHNLTSWCGPNSVCVGIVTFLKIISTPVQLLLLIVVITLLMVGY
jgi:hypothetical protein